MDKIPSTTNDSPKITIHEGNKNTIRGKNSNALDNEKVESILQSVSNAPLFSSISEKIVDLNLNSPDRRKLVDDFVGTLVEEVDAHTHREMIKNQPNITGDLESKDTNEERTSSIPSKRMEEFLGKLEKLTTNFNKKNDQNQRNKAKTTRARAGQHVRFTPPPPRTPRPERMQLKQFTPYAKA